MLLDVYEKEEEFLKSNDRPAPTIDQRVQEEPGQQIGRNKLLQRIGEVSYGVVYMADQQRPVRRKVAHKIIKLGTDIQAVAALFGARQQALAIPSMPTVSPHLQLAAVVMRTVRATTDEET